ncbi:MAG: hypothetical protein QME57_02715 [Patescibacteria group bacterium]|nr:hypothetical protein [Patescibacteria group bacterium]
MFVKFFKISRNIPQILLGIIFNVVEVENQEIKKFEALKNESENQMSSGAGISAA